MKALKNILKIIQEQEWSSFTRISKSWGNVACLS